MLDLLKATFIGLVVILPLANPLTTVAMFLGLSAGMSSRERRKQSFKSSVYVFIIMIVAWYAGQMVMNTFGISVPGLRVAGGMIVAFIGFRMLFPEKKNEQSDLMNDEFSENNTQDIAFIPLAMPCTAGPGTIAMIISAASTAHNNNDFPSWVMLLAPPLVFLCVSIILWGCLLSSWAIMRFVGRSGIDAISRLMGFLLVCMGVQFVINGVLEILH